MLESGSFSRSAPERLIRAVVAGLMLVALFWLIGLYPVAKTALFAGVIVYIICLLKYPHSWLLILPVLLPLLDFSVKTGWFFFTEFDCFVLATVAVVLLRKTAPKVALSRHLRWLITLYGFSVLVSVIVAIWPLPPLDTNAFSNYLSHYNALRVAKGFIMACLLLPALQTVCADAGQVKRYLLTGLLLGFLATAGLMIWERAIFPGLLNFSQAYRATAFFSALHVGGGLIDGYLALTIPFVVAVNLLLPKRWSYPVGLLLLMLALYLLLVTFSRISLLTLIFMGISALVLFAKQSRSPKTFYQTMIPAMLVVVLVAVPVYQAPFFQSRIQTTQQDFQTRWEHWEDTVNLRSTGWVSQLFGMGPGAFPREYYLAHLVPRLLPNYEYRKEGSNPYLHITAGRNFYMVQQIQPQAGLEYELSVTLRPETSQERLTILMCEQALLYAYRCVSQVIRPDKVQQWGVYRAKIKYMEEQNWRKARRHIFLALYLPYGRSADFDNISLTDKSGANLLENNDFSSSFARWYFTDDNHLRWHIENLPLQLWFEQGWIGLLLFLILVGTALAKLMARAWQNDLLAAIYCVSIGGFLLTGLTSSLLDFPKLTFIFYLIFFGGCLHTQRGRSIDGA